MIARYQCTLSYYLGTEESRKLKDPLLIDGYNDIFLREQIDLRSPFPNTLVSFFRTVEREYKISRKKGITHFFLLSFL